MSSLRSFPVVLSLLGAALPLGRPLEAGHPPRHRPLNGYDRLVVERVRARAAARLEDPECMRVLTDFRDLSGRPLHSNLQPAGVTASRYLLGLTFLDGARVARCGKRAVTMVASPGIPRVFVCPEGAGRVTSRLAGIELEGGSLAEAMVIHEMLHTLGLGENPPSTFEITDRVRRRCR